MWGDGDKQALQNCEISCHCIMHPCISVMKTLKTADVAMSGNPSSYTKWNAVFVQLKI